MKTAKLALLLLLGTIGLVRADPTPVGPFNFGKGLNVATIPTDIGDDETPDCSNFINDRMGGAFKRKGSKRFISQAISSNPVNSLYRAYATTGTVVRKMLVAESWDRILYSTNDVSPQWIVASTGNAHNQHYSHVTMNGKVIETGDGLTDPIRQIDIVSNSTATNLLSNDGSSTTVIIRAKYLLQKSNYLIAANCADVTNGTTYYPSRIYYSLLAQPSSMTVQRFIDIRTNDGEQITGMGVLFDAVNIFKESSVHELTFTALNLTSQGGDVALAEVVHGFGCIAPRTLVNNGQYYFFLSKDGIRIWDGGRRSRLTLSEETSLISGKIRPIIDSIIRSGTYKNASAVWYPKKQWYVFSYEDPTKFPRGRANSVLIYDLPTGEWFPFNNWLAEGFTVQDGSGDQGELLYGDSNDGYVHYADVDTSPDDSRKEIAIDGMNNAASWVGATRDTSIYKEGDSSLSMSIGPGGGQSSMTLVSVINAGGWYDKTTVTKDDKIQFKVYPTTVGNITSLRIDLEVNDVEGAFDTNFTSITLSSGSMTGGNAAWTTYEIPLSSFPIRTDWTDFFVGTIPYANTLTYYGVRFVSTGIGSASVNLDDLRIIEATDNPLNAYRFTKLYNFGTPAYKTFGQVLLTREKSAENNFFMDVYNDFGQKTVTQEFAADEPKEIFVCGYNGKINVAKLNSIDFSLKDSTQAAAVSDFYFLNGVADRKYLYVSDRTNDRMVKIDRSSMTMFTATYGAFGSGTTNFNLVHQSALDDNSLFMVDMENQRLKQHAKKDLSYIQSAGSLGLGTSNFYEPTGIAADDNNVFVSDEGNYRLLKLSKSTFGFVAKSDIDMPTFGDSTIQVDEKYLYLAYNRTSETSVSNLNVVLEKRDKSNLKLLNSTTIKPDGIVALSTYSLQGDIALLGDYIFIPFIDEAAGGTYYIQKRLKSDFSLVKEYSSKNQMFSVIGDGLAYKPRLQNEAKNLKSEGKYLQIKYYDSDALDNNFKLYNQTFLVEPQQVKYQIKE